MSKFVPPLKIIYRSSKISLELRAPDVSQIHGVVDAIKESINELKPFMGFAHFEQSAQVQLERMIRAIPAYWLGKDFSFHGYTPGGDFVCGTGLHQRVALNPKGFEIGYWVRKKYQGSGYATLATRMLIVVGFDLLTSDRIQISHNKENKASGRVIEKCGFKVEGEVRNFEPARTPEQLAAGMSPSRTSIGYALTPDDFSQLSWVEEIRAGLEYQYL